MSLYTLMLSVSQKGKKGKEMLLLVCLNQSKVERTY